MPLVSMMSLTLPFQLQSLRVWSGRSSGQKLITTSCPTPSLAQGGRSKMMLGPGMFGGGAPNPCIRRLLVDRVTAFSLARGVRAQALKCHGSLSPVPRN